MATSGRPTGRPHATARAEQATGRSQKLTLVDAVGMAIGGMVGGGIFAVLGQAADLGGHAAFIAFGLAGLLALMTGLAYTRLTLHFDEPGGSFHYLIELVGPGLAGLVSWLLIVAYVFALGLYSYTFGAYAARLAGLDAWGRPVLGAVMIASITGLNLVGARASGRTEDVMVYSKVLILAGLSVVGLFRARSSYVTPVFDTSVGSALVASAVIFIGFEGFELLTYDYADLDRPHLTLPRAMLISIVGVLLLYMLIAFVTTASLDPAVIKAHSETVLADVVEPVLGRTGFAIVTAAALVSTASAVNATLFATSRLSDRLARDHQLPAVLARRQRGGVPVPVLLGLAVMAIIVQAVANLGQIASFSSLLFLLLFFAVNVSAVIHRVFGGVRRIVPIVGAVGCLAALAALVRELALTAPSSLVSAGIVVVIVAALRGWFVLVHSGYRSVHRP